MNQIEHEIMLDLLNILRDYLGNNGCNDMVLEDTPENRQLVESASAFEYEDLNEDEKKKEPCREIFVAKGKIITDDILILNYLIQKFKEDQLRLSDIGEVI